MKLWIAEITSHQGYDGTEITQIIGVFSRAKKARKAIEEVLPDVEWTTPESKDDYYQVINLEHGRLSYLTHTITADWVVVYPMELDTVEFGYMKPFTVPSMEDAIRRDMDWHRAHILNAIFPGSAQQRASNKYDVGYPIR